MVANTLDISRNETKRITYAFYRPKILGFLAFVLSIVNALFFTVSALSLVIAVVETAVIIYYAVKGKLKEFILFFFLFISTTIENPLFALGDRSAELYSFLHLPGVSYYHLFFIIFAFYWFIRIFKTKQYTFNNRRDFTLIAIFLLGFFMFFFSNDVNDNDVASIVGMSRFSIIDAYETVWFLFYGLLILIALENFEGFKEELKDTAIYVLVGTGLAGIFLFLIGNFHYWNDSNIYLVAPLLFFYTPSLIIVSLFKKKWFFYIAIGAASALVQIKYTLGIPGAFWLFLLLVVVVFYFNFFKNVGSVSKKPVLFVSSLLLLIAIPVAIFFISALDPDTNYTAYKLNTLMNLLSFNKDFDEWYLSLGSSIGIRVEQVVNAFIELSEKPWAFIFGKGYGGTFTKHWGKYNWNVYGSIYPDLQVDYKVYSSFLTGIVELVVNFGLFGMVFLLIVIKNTVVELFHRKGSWMYVLGAFWLLVFIYFYNSMMIGLIWFCIGIYERNVRKKGNRIAKRNYAHSLSTVESVGVTR